jgi:hypothetical protein
VAAGLGVAPVLLDALVADGIAVARAVGDEDELTAAVVVDTATTEVASAVGDRPVTGGVATDVAKAVGELTADNDAEFGAGVRVPTAAAVGVSAVARPVVGEDGTSARNA